MTRYGSSLVLVCLLTTMVTPARGQRGTERGATLGGVAGAIAGGIIGHQNDETPEGALIGGAVGAIAGGLLGNAQDQRMTREQQYRQQIWQQQHQIGQLEHQNQSLARAVTLNDVVQMSRSGLSESVIVNQIRSQGFAEPLTTYDVIELHKQGVNERVIAAMQSQATRRPKQVAPARPVPGPEVTPETVIVQREYHVMPQRTYYSPPPRVYVPVPRRQPQVARYPRWYY